MPPSLPHLGLTLKVCIRERISSGLLLSEEDFKLNVETQGRLKDMAHFCPLLAVHYATQVSTEGKGLWR